LGASELLYVVAVLGFAGMISLSFVDPPRPGDRERKVQIWDMHKKAPPRYLPVVGHDFDGIHRKAE